MQEGLPLVEKRTLTRYQLIYGRICISTGGNDTSPVTLVGDGDPTGFIHDGVIPQEPCVMHNDHDVACETILSTFYRDHPHPSRADWWSLIVAHPEHASDLADACLLARSAPWMPQSALPVTEAPVTSLLNRVFERMDTPARDEVRALDERIDNLAGPTLQWFTHDIGLAQHVALADAILHGRVTPPPVLLVRMARLLRSTPAELSLALARRQDETGRAAAARPTPISSKLLAPLSWEEAVRNEGLPAAQTQALLALPNQGD